LQTLVPEGKNRISGFAAKNPQSSILFFCMIITPPIRWPFWPSDASKSARPSDGS
jgi:hypothetical protein